LSENWETKDLIEIKNNWKKLAKEQTEKMVEIKRICNLYNKKGWALNPDKIIGIIEKVTE